MYESISVKNQVLKNAPEIWSSKKNFIQKLGISWN